MKDIQLEAYSLKLDGLTNKEIAEKLTTDNFFISKKMVKKLLKAEYIKEGYTLSKSKQEVFNDWRLPTIKELLTLVDYTKMNPACNLEDTKSNFYWSSTTVVGSEYEAWGVYFYFGYDGWRDKSNSYYVRCVRDGKDSLEWSKSYDKMTWSEAVEFAKTLKAEVYYSDNGTV